MKTGECQGVLVHGTNRAQLTVKANAHCERVIRSIQEEFTDHFWFFGDTVLRHALASYVTWYHRYRPHQGIGNRIIDPGPEIGATVGTIRLRSHMAGTLVHWERVAA